MKKIFLSLLTIVWFLIGFLSPSFVLADSNNFYIDLEDEKTDINFFYGPGCPFCAKEKEFLNGIEETYQGIVVDRHSLEDENSHDLLIDLAENHNAERFLGSVPMTFIGDDFYLGFSDEIGFKIIGSIDKYLVGNNNNSTITEDGGGITTTNVSNVGDELKLPFVGKVNPQKYSLPVLSVMLGFLDGFNVCSLGALVLILGLVIALKSRKKILTLGGLFILTTAIIYGLLIVLWYQLFTFLSAYIGIMRILVGLLGVGGGLFFLNEFRKYRKYCPQCDTSGNKIVSKFSRKVEQAFHNKKNLLFLAGLIFVFAAIITIVEFPCSAAVPVIFAGILAEKGLSTFIYLFYILLFVLFYMIDELIIFIIAVFKMDVWMASPKFVTWAVLVEGIILISLGIYYFMSLV
jgi:glutaredoxin